MSRDTAKAAHDAAGQKRSSRQTAAEWAVFAVSALVIAVAVAVLVVGWVRGASDPPRFRTTVGTARTFEGSHYVPVEVENVGNQTAAEVQVSAKLAVGAEVVDAEQTIDFLAPRERTQVTFVFDRDPSKGRLSVSVSAFREP